MKIKGLKKFGMAPETARGKNGKVYETGEKIMMFIAPDGFKAPYKKFVSEVERGRLHGCVVSSS